MSRTTRRLPTWSLPLLLVACNMRPAAPDETSAKKPKPSYEKALPPSTKGMTAAGTAEKKAEAASEATETAQKPTEKAAETAQKVAETPDEAAETAQKVAETPDEAAETAQKVAETPDEAAETARKAAETAQRAAETEEPEKALTRGEVLGLPYAVLDLENGLRAIAVKTDIPDVVSLQIVVRTGSRNEVEPGKSGFAHFFEHMMFRGTEAYPADVYGDILKKAGADQNAYTSDDLTNYHVTFTKADLDQILEVEADRFQNLAYTEEQFRTEALAVKGEYLKNYSNPLLKMLEKLRSLAFTVHPYRHTTMGFFEDIQKMPDQIEYAKKFFDRYYRPNNTVVLVVGDVEPEPTLRKVKKHFGDWEAKTYDPEIPEEPAPKGPKHAHLEWDAPTQAWLFFGFRGPAFASGEGDMPALEALASLAFSEASPLYRKLVIEEQWVDELLTWFPKRRDPGLLHVGARLLDPKHADAVRDAIQTALVELQTRTLHPSWVDRTKSRLRYQLARSLEASDTAASELASLIHFERTPETMDELFAAYAEITPAQVQAAAQTYFTDQRKFLVTLSNDEALPGFDPLESIDALTATAATFFGGAIETVDAPETTTATVGVEVRKELLPSSTTPLVTLSYVFTTGAAYDPPGKKGLAALTAAMIADGGTEDLTLAQINEAMYPMAADFDWQIDKEMTRFSGTVHQDKLEDYYAFASAQLLDPGFRAEDLERNKKKLVSAIRTDLVANNDEELAKEVLYEQIYGPGHPYASYNLGEAEEVEKLTLDDVKQFYEAHYRPRGIILGLAGGYPDGFAEKVERDLAALPRGQDAILRLPEPPVPEGRRALIIEKKTPGVAVSAGFPIDVKRGDPDWIALWLARSWLGEHRSSASHLYQQIREKRGMNYGDYAYIEYFPRGMFQFHPDPNLARRHQIFQIWLRPFRNNVDAHFGTRLAVKELEDLVQKGLSEEQFEATRSYLKKFVALLTQTQTRQLGYAIDAAYYGTQDFTTYVRRGLDALTVGAVNRAIREHLDPSKMSFVFVTRDAASLLRRLARDMPSEIEYNTPKPELAGVDAAVAKKPLGFDAVTFVPAEEIF